jgi:hypothetical protein
VLHTARPPSGGGAGGGMSNSSGMGTSSRPSRIYHHREPAESK